MTFVYASADGARRVTAMGRTRLGCGAMPSRWHHCFGGGGSQQTGFPWSEPRDFYSNWPSLQACSLPCARVLSVRSHGALLRLLVPFALCPRSHCAQLKACQRARVLLSPSPTTIASRCVQLPGRVREKERWYSVLERVPHRTLPMKGKRRAGDNNRDRVV